jgi:hypothetical protein
MIKQTDVSIAGKKFYLIAGASFSRFGIGFSADKYTISIDLGFVWLAVEL